jgi:hypothetical protein
MRYAHARVEGVPQVLEPGGMVGDHDRGLGRRLALGLDPLVPQQEEQHA